MNSDAVMAEARGAAERLAIVAEKPAHLIRWGEGDRLDLQSVLAALSPPSTGGVGEDWDRIPRAKRFGRRLNESAVKHLAPGTLLRFYSEDPWFDPSPSSPANGDIVVFTGEVSNTFPKVGPHLEVRTLGGRVYPGGGWVYQIFQFVADPSPEMGEISREDALIMLVEAFEAGCYAVHENYQPDPDPEFGEAAHDYAISKLKENGLSREELGGSARAGSGAAGPSDCAENGPLSLGGKTSYRGWWIDYDPPPIPVRTCDWQFWHDDYDGAPTHGDEGPADNRCGSAPSLEAARAEIDFWIEENFDCRCSASDPGDCMAIECKWRKPGVAR